MGQPSRVDLSRGTKQDSSRLPKNALFMDQLDPGSAVFNLPVAVRLFGSLNVAALNYALDEIVGRHEVLRSRFEIGSDDKPRQIVTPMSRAAFRQIDLRGYSSRRLKGLLTKTEFVLLT